MLPDGWDAYPSLPSSVVVVAVVEPVLGLLLVDALLHARQLGRRTFRADPRRMVQDREEGGRDVRHEERKGVRGGVGP